MSTDREFIKQVWFVDKDDPLTHPFESWHVHNATKTITKEIKNEADAKRIADCLNACNGMEIPFNTIVRAMQQREKLLVVLKDCDRFIAADSNSANCMKFAINNVIAEVERKIVERKIAPGPISPPRPKYPEVG